MYTLIGQLSRMCWKRMHTSSAAKKVSYKFFRPKKRNKMIAAQCVYFLDICSRHPRISAFAGA